MEFYKFDQTNLGKYQYSNNQAKKTLETRTDEICRSLKKALHIQTFLGVLFFASALLLFRQMYCAPLYLSIIWAFVWNTTMLRTYFAIHNMWRLSVRKDGRKIAFFRIRKLFYAQLLFLLWFAAMVGFYCHLGMGFAFTGTLLVIGIALTCIAYALSYMSCSQKNLQWWEFSNDNEHYWVLGKDD